MTVSAKQTCKFIIAISTKKSNDTDITPYRCSHVIHYAADRNRTGTGITTHRILSPGRLPVPPLRRIPFGKMDGGGFEPPKQYAADLQSVPFGHSGIHPYCHKALDKILLYQFFFKMQAFF